MLKVILMLPTDLTNRALKFLGRRSPKEALHQQACKELLELQGKVDLKIDLNALRED